MGVLVEVAKVFTEREINVTAMQSRTGKNQAATINVCFDVSGRAELTKIVDKLRALDCVYDVERTRG